MELTEIARLVQRDYSLLMREKRLAARMRRNPQLAKGGINLGELCEERERNWNQVARHIGKLLGHHIEGDFEVRDVIEQREHRHSSTGMSGSSLRANLTENRLYGYPVVFWANTEGTQYQMGYGVVERIHPNSLDSTLANKKERERVSLLLGHNPDFIIANVRAGTLTLTTDKRGLHFSAIPAKSSPLDQHVVAHVARGDIAGGSFTFTPRSVDWSRDGNLSVRTIMDMVLHEVTLTPWPAYPGTTASV